MALINPKQISLIAPIDATGPLSASGDVLLVTATGRNTLVVALPISAWSGTILVEGTAYGDFSDATALSLIPYGGGAALAALAAGGIYELSITGLSAVRLRATTAITGGPITALLRAAMGSKSVRVGAPVANPVPVQAQPGFTPAQTYVAVPAFTAGNTAGTGGRNATVVLATTTAAAPRFLSIDNTGSNDAEIRFGAIPADAKVGQSPKQGKPLPAGAGLFLDAAIPAGVPIYVTAASATGLSVVTG